MSMWFEEHGLQQDDPHVVPRLRDFLRLIASPPPLALTAKLMLQSLERIVSRTLIYWPANSNFCRDCIQTTPYVQSPVSSAASTHSRRHKSSRSSKSELLRHDPTDIAQQLCLYEHRLYSIIRPRECLRWASVRKGETVANLNLFCATHDKLAAWVKHSVLLNDGPGKRADTIDFWIKVAEVRISRSGRVYHLTFREFCSLQKCRLLNNFSSTSAITAALSSAELTRLHLTWAHVGRGSQLASLVRLNEPSANFSAYRSLLQTVSGPCVPFIGIFLTDIVHIHDQLRDWVVFPSSTSSQGPSSAVSSSSSSSSLDMTLPPAESPTGVQLINFVKRQRWFDAVNAIVRFQGKTYAHVENPTTMSFVAEQLMQSGLKDPNMFWTRSQELQQTELAHADIRKGLEAAGF